MLEGGQRVGGLTRLADDDHQRPRVRDAVPVAVFARDLDLRRDLRDRFEPVLRREAGVVAGAARQDQHGVDVGEHGGRLSAVVGRIEQPGADRAAVVRQALERVGDGARLLEDLLLHVVPVRTELGRPAVRVDGAGLAGHRSVRAVGDPVAAELDVDRVAVLQIDDAIGHTGEGHRVRREEALTCNGGTGAVASLVRHAAEDQRRPVAGADDAMRLLAAEHRDGIRADEALQRRPRRIEEVAVVQRVDEVGDHLGIGLADEDVAFRDQLRPQRLVVLDDAVVDQRDPRRLVRRRKMRMRVVRRRCAVRGPAGVGDAGESRERGLLHLRVEFGDARDTACAFRPKRVINCHAARVVSAIFEALQSFDEDWDDVSRTDRGDDSAHGISFDDFGDAAGDEREPIDVGLK